MEVVITVGGSEAIDIGLRAMINPGDEVIIPQPSYVSYEPCAILTGAKPVIIDLKAENEFRLTAAELEEAITDRTKVLILPFPNNPTGAIMEKKDLEAIAQVVIKHDIFVMSDEIYSELTYKEKHVSIASLPGMRERTILINGISKWPPAGYPTNTRKISAKSLLRCRRKPCPALPPPFPPPETRWQTPRWSCRIP